MLVQKFNYIPLERETTDRGRLYSLPDESRVPSVTTILDATQSQEKRMILENWRNSIGHQRAQSITTEAANRGTRMHAYLEQHIKGGINNPNPSNPYAKQSLRMAQEIINKAFPHVSEVWGCEVALYYSGIYAGTTDCVGLWKGMPAIMDFKQSNRVKTADQIEDYYLQLASYSLAHNHMYGTTIDQGVVLMCTKDYQYLEFELSGQEFQRSVEKWWDRVEMYYDRNK